MNINTNEVIKIIDELQLKKKNYDDCFSERETVAIREWNKAIDECINAIITMYKN